MAIIYLKQAQVVSKPTVRLKTDGKLQATVSVKEDGVYYTASTRHVNISFSLMTLRTGEYIDLSGTLALKPYMNTSGYPSVVKTVYLQTISFNQQNVSSETEESDILHYKLLKHVINRHAKMAADSRQGRGLASLETCIDMLKKLHEELCNIPYFSGLKHN